MHSNQAHGSILDASIAASWRLVLCRMSGDCSSVRHWQVSPFNVNLHSFPLRLISDKFPSKHCCSLLLLSPSPHSFLIHKACLRRAPAICAFFAPPTVLSPCLRVVAHENSLTLVMFFSSAYHPTGTGQKKPGKTPSQIMR